MNPVSTLPSNIGYIVQGNSQLAFAKFLQTADQFEVPILSIFLHSRTNLQTQPKAWKNALIKKKQIAFSYNTPKMPIELLFLKGGC